MNESVQKLLKESMWDLAACYDAKSLESYQIKGKAEYVTEGTVVETFKKIVEQMFNGGAMAKGAL